jgi:hypothetical protein
VTEAWHLSFTGLARHEVVSISPSNTAKVIGDRTMMLTLPPDYRPSEDEEFMNPIQTEYFRQKLLRWRAELLR